MIHLLQNPGYWCDDQPMLFFLQCQGSGYHIVVCLTHAGNKKVLIFNAVQQLHLILQILYIPKTGLGLSILSATISGWQVLHINITPCRNPLQSPSWGRMSRLFHTFQYFTNIFHVLILFVLICSSSCLWNFTVFLVTSSIALTYFHSQPVRRDKADLQCILRV